jgi:hypothetical protein
MCLRPQTLLRREGRFSGKDQTCSLYTEESLLLSSKLALLAGVNYFFRRIASTDLLPN